MKHRVDDEQRREWRLFKTATEKLLGKINTTGHAVSPKFATDVIEHFLRQFPNRQINPEDIKAMRKTYTIDLKIDFEDEGRHKIALTLMRKAARTILTQASLIADGRAPQVAFHTNDFFEGGTSETLTDIIEEIPELPASEPVAETEEEQA